VVAQCCFIIVVFCSCLYKLCCWLRVSGACSVVSVSVWMLSNFIKLLLLLLLVVTPPAGCLRFSQKLAHIIYMPIRKKLWNRFLKFSF